MAEKRKSNPRVRRCVQNGGYEASLELKTIACATPTPRRESDVRVVDESGEDYLYPAAWFVALDVPKAVQESLLKAS